MDFQSWTLSYITTNDRQTTVDEVRGILHLMNNKEQWTLSVKADTSMNISIYEISFDFCATLLLLHFIAETFSFHVNFQNWDCADVTSGRETCSPWSILLDLPLHPYSHSPICHSTSHVLHSCVNDPDIFPFITHNQPLTPPQALWQDQCSQPCHLLK